MLEYIDIKSRIIEWMYNIHSFTAPELRDMLNSVFEGTQRKAAYRIVREIDENRFIRRNPDGSFTYI